MFGGLLPLPVVLLTFAELLLEYSTTSNERGGKLEEPGSLSECIHECFQDFEFLLKAYFNPETLSTPPSHNLQLFCFLYRKYQTKYKFYRH